VELLERDYTRGHSLAFCWGQLGHGQRNPVLNIDLVNVDISSFVEINIDRLHSPCIVLNEGDIRGLPQLSTDLLFNRSSPIARDQGVRSAISWRPPECNTRPESFGRLFQMERAGILISPINNDQNADRPLLERAA